MEITECTKESGYKEVKPNIVSNHSSSIFTTYSTREENTKAYTHTGSHLTTMGRTDIEKYNPNYNKDGDSKLANKTVTNYARAAFEVGLHSS